MAPAELLLLDEPTSGLTLIQQEATVRSGARDGGATVFLPCHQRGGGDCRPGGHYSPRRNRRSRTGSLITFLRRFRLR